MTRQEYISYQVLCRGGGMADTEALRAFAQKA